MDRGLRATVQIREPDSVLGGMGRDLRYLPPGMLVEVTTRTVQGRYLLRPSRQLNELVVGVLARAARRTSVGVCIATALSNHLQALLVHSDAEALAAFMGYVNGNIAREANRLHGWSGPLWSRRYRAIVISDDPDDQIERFQYILEQGTKEGLVWRPKDWPGVHCAGALVSGQPLRGHWFDRTARYQARRRGEAVGRYDYSCEETLHLEPLPCWKDLSPGDRQARAAELIHQIEHDNRARHREAGTSPMGVKQILRQHPHSAPAQLATSPAPRFHASCYEVWRCLQAGYWEFLAAFRQAAADLRAGVRNVEFPVGSFPPRQPFVRGSPAFASG